ncbi:MAG: 4Fe-4S dicluster domain-containing protein [Gemmatimonadetes bacterium]|nr:4Fe-4S dicluster domain-containing protein [Gemmatimonadota bacterium]
MDRRDLLKTMGVAAASAASAALGPLSRDLEAQEPAGGPADRDRVGVLVDTTRCIGCRMCEYACAKANGLPEPPDTVDFNQRRETSESQWTVVNRYETQAGPVYVKTQCMHCLQPACATACLTRAMYRTPEGPVVWREPKCMGCRFCMISCPFDIPKFEYDSAVPKIQKCRLCWERLQEGKQPACVANCPVGALEVAPRAALLEEARSRIYTEPDRYVHHIYGEDEAGGTSWLYLAPVAFDELAFRTDLGTTPYPEYAREFLYAVPFVLTLVPPFLLGLSSATKRGPDGDLENEE